MLSRLACLLAIPFTVAFSPVCSARAAAPLPRPARDLTGDPLPAGAPARLGSTRLSQPGVICMTFALDDKALATIDDAGAVRLWDVAAGKLHWRAETVRIMGRAANWSPLGFSPDGKLLAMAAQDRSVRVWDVANGRERNRLMSPFHPNVVRFAPDSRHLAVGGYGHTMQIWDCTGKGGSVPLGDLTRAEYLAYIDRKTLISVSFKSAEDLSCAVWTVTGGKREGQHEVPWGSSFAPLLAPDGRFLAISDRDGKRIRLYDPATGKLLRRTEGEADYPRGLAFAADGSALTATSRDGLARVWATATGKLLHRFRGLPGVIRQVALSPDGKVLALAGRGGRGDETIRLWDLSGPQPRLAAGDWGHGHGPLTVAFAADGKTVLTASREATARRPALDGVGWSLRRWEPATGRHLSAQQEYTGGEVTWTKFSPDGRLLAVVTHEGTLRLWDTAAGKELRRWMVPTRDFGWIDKAGKVVQRFPHAALGDLAFSADGKVLLAMHGVAVHRWDVATGKALETFSGWEKTSEKVPARGPKRDFGECWCVPSPDGETLLLAGSNITVTRLVLASAASGRKLRELPAEPGRCRSAAFSPDGRTLAVIPSSSRQSSFIRLLEVAGGRERGRLTGPPTFAEGLAFSPNGQVLVSGCGRIDNIVRIWDLTGEAKFISLQGHQMGVTSLAFSPDGRLLASAGRETSALVWDIRRLLAGRAPETSKLAQADLDGLWRDLCGIDAVRAYAAIRKLARAPGQSVPLLCQRLRSLPRTDAKHVARLIAGLDDEAFAQRERAGRDLERLGEAVEDALRQAAKNSPSLEVRTRAERLLKALEKPEGQASPRLIALRVLEALENAATVEARKLVDELARAAVSDEVARAASATSRRIQAQAGP
jgi:WD40 repeat protein